jgi:hypothetical protein
MPREPSRRRTALGHPARRTRPLTWAYAVLGALEVGSGGALALVPKAWLFAPAARFWFFLWSEVATDGGVLLLLLWLHAAWRGVPAPFRGTVTPNRAVYSFCIPFYDVYWFFVVYVALCDALDEVLLRAGAPRRAPRTLAIVACASSIGSRVIVHGLARHAAASVAVALVTFGALHALWVVTMVRCDAAREAVAELGDPGTDAAPPLTGVRRDPAPGAAAIAGYFFVLLVLLALWQLVTPAR